MKKLNQSGSHVLVAILILAVVGVVGFAGYKVSQSRKTKTGSSAQTAATAQVPATITNTAELNQASDVLDQSASQLNSSLDDSGLNSDLNSML